LRYHHGEGVGGEGQGEAVGADAAGRIDDNPMIWFIMVNGLPFDARELPVEIQLEACLNGVIPYVPALGREGTAAAMAAQRS
jgi:hypothetical protein